MIPAKIYPLTIPAGGSFPLQATGDFFKVLSATGAFEITGDSFGAVGQIEPGQGLERTPFGRLTFRDISGAANNVRVLVADERFVDDRITGEVSVIDAGYARTVGGAAFMTLHQLATTLAANNAGIQVINEGAAGTKNIVVEQLTFVSSQVCGVNLYLHNVGLTTAVKVANSKLGGGADSAVARIRSAEAAGGWGGKLIANYAIDVVNKSVVYQPKTPIVLPPGWGLICADTVTTAIHTTGVTFEHAEVPIV